MTRAAQKKAAAEIDTWTIGPSVCGSFNAHKDCCHTCVAKKCWTKWICHQSPNLR